MARGIGSAGSGGAPRNVESDFKAKQKQLTQAKKKVETAKMKLDQAARQKDSYQDIPGKFNEFDDLRSRRSDAKKAWEQSQGPQRPGEDDAAYKRRTDKQTMDKRMYGMTEEQREFTQLDEEYQKKKALFTQPKLLKDDLKDAKHELKEAKQEFARAEKEYKSALKHYAPVAKERRASQVEELTRKADRAKAEADRLKPKIKTQDVSYEHKTIHTKDHKGKVKTQRIMQGATVTKRFRTEGQKAQLQKDLDEYQKLRDTERSAREAAEKIKTGRWKHDEKAAIRDMKKELKK